MSSAIARPVQPRPSSVSTDADAAAGSRESGLRRLMDSVLSLAIAVVMFRAFAVEGYIISTGSMAPNLLGYHKRLECPVCEFSFAVGVAFEGPRRGGSATCPNCGRGGIDVRDVPRNEGDQLLVHKHAFLFKLIRRWEVVVFSNPNKPTQAYVKRVVGLPGEDVQLVDGDIHVGGQIQRKDLRRQRAVRIPVFDFDHQPSDTDDWQPRWVSEPGWQQRGGGFEFDKSRAITRRLSSPGLRWVTYRNWVRSGGKHETAVPIDRLPDGLRIPESILTPVYFDSRTNELRCTGVLTDASRERLLAMSTDPDWQQAINRLDEESHLSPITDQYGYNRHGGFSRPQVVRDLMLSARVKVGHGPGTFALEMTDGEHVYRCRIDLESRRIELRVDGNTKPVRAGTLPDDVFRQPQDSALLEMSIIDRQVLIAIQNRLTFERLSIPSHTNGEADYESANGEHRNKRRKAPRRPVRFGTDSVNVRVDLLKLYRDVHYTRGGARNGVDRAHRLGPDEYFFLGDNSPVSLDSRGWPNAVVTGQMILGKPFLVHLPSKPGRIRIGSYEGHIRIPDVSRIRYIR